MALGSQGQPATMQRDNKALPESKGRLSYCDFAFPSSLFLRVTISWDRNFFASTVGERTPHKSTPFRAASYFRPDPVRGSPSRSPLTNSFLTHSFIKCGANSQTASIIAAFLAPSTDKRKYFEAPRTEQSFFSHVREFRILPYHDSTFTQIIQRINQWNPTLSPAPIPGMV